MTTQDFRIIGRTYALEAVNASPSFATTRDALAAYYRKLADRLSQYSLDNAEVNQAYKAFHAVVDTLETV